MSALVQWEEAVQTRDTAATDVQRIFASYAAARTAHQVAIQATETLLVDALLDALLNRHARLGLSFWAVLLVHTFRRVHRQHCLETTFRLSMKNTREFGIAIDSQAQLRRPIDAKRWAIIVNVLYVSAAAPCAVAWVERGPKRVHVNSRSTLEDAVTKIASGANSGVWHDMGVEVPYAALEGVLAMGVRYHPTVMAACVAHLPVEGVPEMVVDYIGPLCAFEFFYAKELQRKAERAAAPRKRRLPAWVPAVDD